MTDNTTHPYVNRLDKTLSHFSVVRGGDLVPLKGGDHFPREGMTARTITTGESRTDYPLAFVAWIVPEPKGGNAHHSHRVRCACPHCGAHMSAGRMGQHYGSARCILRNATGHRPAPSERPW